MLRYFLIFFLFICTSISNAEVKEKIIQNLKDTKNLDFKFEQNINGKIENGNCTIEYPKKIFCEYAKSNNKILVSNGKSLVVKNTIKIKVDLVIHVSCFKFEMMIIEQIDLYHVKMPLLEPWVTAYGSQNDIESVFVKIVTDGISGWGECAPSPLPLYNSEFSAGAFVVARDIMAPRLIGKKVISGEFLQDTFSDLKGHQFAKSAFDGAWWDAHSQRLETPLWSLIGGTREVVPVGADIPVLSSTDELLKRVEISIQGGFPRIKLKFNRQCSVDMIKQVRDAFPGLIMLIDCNSGFTLDDIAMFQELDKLDLKMIEQPLSYDDLVLSLIHI